MRSELDPSNLTSFILAGKSLLTIENSIRGTHKTLSFMRDKHREDLWYVYIRGDKDKAVRLPGFETKKNWLYCGIVVWESPIKNQPKELAFKLTKGSKILRGSEGWKAIDWFIRNINVMPDYCRNKGVKIYHEGVCGRCGRTLTDPVSIQAGFGPECIKRVN